MYCTNCTIREYVCMYVHVLYNTPASDDWYSQILSAPPCSERRPGFLSFPFLSFSFSFPFHSLPLKSWVEAELNLHDGKGARMYVDKLHTYLRGDVGNVGEWGWGVGGWESGRLICIFQRNKKSLTSSRKKGSAGWVCNYGMYVCTVRTVRFALYFTLLCFSAAKFPPSGSLRYITELHKRMYCTYNTYITYYYLHNYDAKKTFYVPFKNTL